jgi:hypothetical protein
MTDATPYRATAEQWQSLENDDSTFPYEACILELRARIEALEAGAVCPHVVTSDEGTSYCGLAEQQAAASAPPKPAPAGSLVERVAIACAKPCNETWDDQARAARRPKPPSLAEEALALIRHDPANQPFLSKKGIDTLRRALERLQQLEDSND